MLKTKSFGSVLVTIFIACLLLLGSCYSGSGIFKGYSGKTRPQSQVAIVTAIQDAGDRTVYNFLTVNGKKIKYFYRGDKDRIALLPGPNTIKVFHYQNLGSGSPGYMKYADLGTQDFTFNVVAGKRYKLHGSPLILEEDETAIESSVKHK